MQIAFIDGAIHPFITGPALENATAHKNSADRYSRRNGREAQVLQSANLRGIER